VMNNTLYIWNVVYEEGCHHTAHVRTARCMMSVACHALTSSHLTRRTLYILTMHSHC
jgi:hypothetical protein